MWLVNAAYQACFTYQVCATGFGLASLVDPSHIAFLPFHFSNGRDRI